MLIATLSYSKLEIIQL